jgi:acetolactate synthase-1/2/3 large subunit
MRHGGKILIDQLEAQGARAVFTVPGESFLAALDGLHDSNRIRTVICRQEGGASMMADAWGKLTGEPGICMVTRGPGAANAMAGLHIAQQDSTPTITFIGMPPSEHEDREAFQEIELKQLFSSYVKWAAVINDAARIPEYVSRAFHVSCSGRPGPVVLGLPEDMLEQTPDIADAKAANIAEPIASPQAVAALEGLLTKAKKPLMIVGGPGWSGEIKARAEAFASRWELPIAAAFRYQDYIDNRHPCYAGHVGIGIDGKLKSAVTDADLLIVVGARLGEITTSGYTLLAIPNPKQTLVHVHPGADEIGSVYRADLAVNASARSFIAALEGIKPKGPVAWVGRARELHTAYLDTLKPLPTPGAVSFPEVLRTLSEMLPDDAIISNGAGNYAAFLHRYFQYKTWRTQLAPTSGSMGYGLPAAIAGKLVHPERMVVNFAGDGCFLMTGQELATAAQYGLNIITIIANNGMYGTIRMHQEREFPSRVVGTTLMNPDFAAYARSFGAHGETVTSNEQFKGAFERAAASGKPAIIELKIDPEALSPRQTLTQIRNSKS